MLINYNIRLNVEIYNRYLFNIPIKVLIPLYKFLGVEIYI